jgi:putative hemolysin
VGDREREPRFSYVNGEDPPLKRLLVRAVEAAADRSGKIRRARAFVATHPDAAGFWADLPAAAGIEVSLAGAPLAAVPRAGPLLVVANHPFGVLDGMILGSVVAGVRGDFLLLTNARLPALPQVARQWLAVDLEEGGPSRHRRADAARRALRHLQDGGCVVIFPAGVVATTPRLMASRAVERPWAPGLGVLLRRSRAAVLPVFVHGQNSRLFQAASHLSAHLRAGLFLREALAGLDRPMRLTVGRPLPREALPLEAPDLPARLRAMTLALGETTAG